MRRTIGKITGGRFYRRGRVPEDVAGTRLVAMKLFSLVILVLLLPPPSAEAADGLEPCRDVFSDSSHCYHAAVRRLLIPEHSGPPVRLARMVVIPSFEAEWAVTLYPAGRSPTVELRVASKPLWPLSEDCSSSGDTTAGVETVFRSASVPADLAGAIADVWREALLDLDARQDAWSRGSDGITYHASAWIEGHGPLCGETWSPSRGAAETLASLAHLLRAYAEEPSDSKAAELRKLVRPEAEEIPP